MKITLVSDLYSPEGNVPGAVELRDMDGQLAGIAFRCPCGCGYDSWLPINNGENKHGWDWNGDRENISLTPSVLQSGIPCKWHGYLTKGNWESC